jgi:hypothetical protein
MPSPAPGPTYAVYWHLGLPKTASTYLQQRFFAQLTGVHYLHRTRFERALRAIEEKKHAGPVLYSREVGSDLEAKAKFVAQWHPEIRPIVVLRSHRQLIASYYRNRIKNGNGESFHEFLNLEGGPSLRRPEEFYLFPKLRSLERLFEHPPYVLFYEDFKRAPENFFTELANYLGVNCDPTSIDSRPANASYTEKQLRCLRAVARHCIPAHERPEQKLQKWYTEVLRHSVLWTTRFVPIGLVHRQPLITERDAAQIDAYYADDWQRCLTFARQQPAIRQDRPDLNPSATVNPRTESLTS